MLVVTCIPCATRDYYQSSNEVASWVASATCGIYERCACFYTWFARWHTFVHCIQRDSYICHSLAASAAYSFDANSRCDCAAMDPMEQFQFVHSHSAEIAHFELVDPDFIFRLAQSDVFRAMYIDAKPKPSPNEVNVTRLSQDAESRKRRDEIRLDILITLRRALPRDITDVILKSSIHKIRVAACPDKLIATDPVCSNCRPRRSYQKRSQRPPRAIAPYKHRGR